MKGKIEEDKELVQEWHILHSVVCTMHSKEHTGQETERSGGTRKGRQRMECQSGGDGWTNSEVTTVQVESMAKRNMWRRKVLSVQRRERRR